MVVMPTVQEYITWDYGEQAIISLKRVRYVRIVHMYTHQAEPPARCPRRPVSQRTGATQKRKAYADSAVQAAKKSYQGRLPVMPATRSRFYPYILPIQTFFAFRGYSTYLRTHPRAIVPQSLLRVLCS